jgi:CubicO group peptidase (beta-lactamase class C family)
MRTFLRTALAASLALAAPWAAGVPSLPTQVGRPALLGPGAQALDEASQYVQATQGQVLVVVQRGVVRLARRFDADAAAAGGRVVSLDEPASTWLAAWRDTPRAGITLRQLLAADAGSDAGQAATPGLSLARVADDGLLVLRIGHDSPAWRDQVLPQLIVAALHPERPADWDWLYAWRTASPPAPGGSSVLDFARPRDWPVERVAGHFTGALPRHASACLTDASLAPALAEIRRVRSYAFLVWRHGAIEFEYYAPGYGPDSRADPASMHKSVLGLLYGQALADGYLPGLEAPVSRWLPEWADDPRGAITLRQMLQMASGLAPLAFDLRPGAPYGRALYGGDNAAVPLASTLADAPGTTFNYASGISQLLGLILERATGRRYADYLSERLWQPLGADDAFVALDHPGGHARTSSALFARPEDWVRLGLLFAQRGQVGGRQVVDPAWLDAMAAPSPANPNYGLQLWRASPHAAQRRYNSATPVGVPAREPFLADDMLFFDGAGAQRVYVSAAEQLVIVRIGAGTFDWDDSAVPNVVTAAARACPSR